MVLFVCLARGVGGSSRSLATVLEHLGSRVTRVIAAPRVGSFPAFLAERSLMETHIPIPNPARGPLQRLSRLEAARRIARWARRHRESIAAIHANGPEELNVAIPSALAVGAPIVVWSHAREVSRWMRILAPLWRRLPRRLEIRWAAVSPDARRVLADSGLTGADAVSIVPNPIDPADVRADGREPSGTPRIGYLGSDARYKGFHLLPDVIERSRDLPARWLLFTAHRSEESGAAWERLRAMPESLVEIPGKLPDVRRAYARCDVVVIPSLDESFCRVAAEAMLNGIPVAASDLEPVRRLVGDEEAGLLFPPGDVEAAASAVRRLVLDPDGRARLGERGRERAGAFDPAAVVRRLSALYGLAT